MPWLDDFAQAAAHTDRLVGHSDHIALLATGLFGEAGGVLAELKKQARERDAYPAYRLKMLEEIGDLLWYYVRLVTLVDTSLFDELTLTADSRLSQTSGLSLPVFLSLGSAVGQVLAAIGTESDITPSTEKLRPLLSHVWDIVIDISHEAQIELQTAARGNLQKIRSRWPSDRTYTDFFDEAFPEEEQLPRRLEVDFHERPRGDKQAVILRCNGLNLGDSLTDNIRDPDGYRYHDVFHFANAAYLGWSPVMRALLRCKRKSNPLVDEGEDGARAAIIEEAISAVIFARAKRLGFFDGIDHVDFDLLKIIKEFVGGFEIERVPLWQWEEAILGGYRVFRQLRHNRGGRVLIDLFRRECKYVAG